MCCCCENFESFCSDRQKTVKYFLHSKREEGRTEKCIGATLSRRKDKARRRLGDFHINLSAAADVIRTAFVIDFR